MTDPRIAESGRYRRLRPLERAAGWLGRIPEGPLRRWLRGIFRSVLARRPLTCTLPGGERIRIDAAYRFVTWNPAEYDAFRSVVRPGDLVLDVGANVGAYTLLFAEWVGQAGRVVAFEPSPDAAAALRRHLSLNAQGSRVAVREEAVADRSGREALAGEGVQGTSRLTPGATGTLLVPTVTLDEVCAAAAGHPTLVKIDVEGAELRVLRGARRLLTAEPLPAIFVELHPSLWPEVGVTRAELEAELDGLGLRVEALRPGIDPWSLEGECVRLVRR